MLARRLAVYVVCVLGVTVGFALGAGSALAGVVHPPVGSFGSEGTGAGSFGNVQSIAVEESTGDVYVYDLGSYSIYKFTASGEPVEFSALKSNAIPNVIGFATETQIAVDGSNGPAKGDIYVADTFTVMVYGPDGKYLGELNGEGHPSGEPCGVAVDASGNVYVGLYPNFVNKYAPKGGLVTNNDYESTLFTGDGLCHVAADESGNVYTLEWTTNVSGWVREYPAGDFNVFGGPPGRIVEHGFDVAVNRVNGDAYVPEGSQILQYDSVGNRLGATGGLSGSYTSAINGASDQLYASETASGRVRVFGPGEIVPDVVAEEASELQPTSATLKGTVNPSGVQVTSCEFEYWVGTRYGHVVPCEQQPGSGTGPVTVTAKISGLTESTAYNYRLKAANAKDGNASEVATFETYGRPVVALFRTNEITGNSARVVYRIDPHGYETTYRLEYGIDTKYGQNAPVPDGNAGSTDGFGYFVFELTGLEQGTTYHYRVVAVNSHGEASGEDQTFTTEPDVGIRHVWSSEVSRKAAQVHAGISPRGLQTVYRFEYGTDTNYGSNVPVPDGTIGAQYGENTAMVSELLQGLAPGTTYHFRVSATNANGTDVSPDVSFTTPAQPQAEKTGCPDIRAGLSADLPDCRAYELVSPAEKGVANVATEPTLTQSSVGGDAIKYRSTSLFATAPGIGISGADYVAQRGANGWATTDIDPFQAGAFEPTNPQSYVNFSEDLSKGLYLSVTPVVPGHPKSEKVNNLYLRTNVLSAGAGNYTLLTDPITEPSPLPPVRDFEYGVEIAGTSADYSRVLFESIYNLTPETQNLSQSVPKVYEWENGVVRLESILPDGSIATEALAGGGAGGGLEEKGKRKWLIHSLSADGSRAVFTAPPLVHQQAGDWGLGGNLYMRINDSETVQLNASERTAPDPRGPGPARFWGATPDDSKVFFASDEMLTDDAENDGDSSRGTSNIYEYDLNAPKGKRLTLISVDNEPAGGGADRGDAAIGVSEDGSYVYFISHNKLLPGVPSFGNPLAQLYVWHNGTLRFIERHDGSDAQGWGWGDYGSLYEGGNFRMTPDGKTIAFLNAIKDKGATTAYDNAGPDCQMGTEAGAPTVSRCVELFVYSYETNKITCASCNPSGAVTDSNASFTSELDGFAIPRSVAYQNRMLSSDGRYVFFDTHEALVPQDTNGAQDVYEFDTRTGQVHLISSGGCDCNSYFVDASADARNVFFTTRERLVRADFDGNADLYDARVEGGIPSQYEAPPGPCEGDDCQGPAPSQPMFSAPASATFNGVGNNPMTVNAKPKVKKRAVKHKRRKAKKRHRGKAKRASHRAGR